MCAEGNARRRRSKEEERGEGDIECHPEIAEVKISMEGRLKEGASREELYHARMKRARKANEDEAREKRARGRKRRAKEISELSEVFKGMERGKMAGAGDWGRSMNLRGKAWGGGWARRRKGGRGAPWGGCLEGMA